MSLISLCKLHMILKANLGPIAGGQKICPIKPTKLCTIELENSHNFVGFIGQKQLIFLLARLFSEVLS